MCGLQIIIEGVLSLFTKAVSLFCTYALVKRAPYEMLISSQQTVSRPDSLQDGCWDTFQIKSVSGRGNFEDPSASFLQSQPQTRPVNFVHF